MIKKITVERDYIFCDHCGKRLDPYDEEYHGDVYEVYGDKGDYCRGCAELAWVCNECEKTFWSDEVGESIKIDGKDYCLACAKKRASEILAEIAEREKQNG